MRIVWAFAVAACAAAPTRTTAPGPARTTAPAPTRTTPPAPARWVYRVYTSGVESNHESVTTWVLDERTGSADATEQQRDGRGAAPWTARPATHYTLSVSHGAELQLALTALDGAQTRYACTRRELEVAPATAMRTSLGGESGWKQGRWTTPTQRTSVDVCHADSGTDLLLAALPLEHVVADDACCGDAPSLRFVPADGAIVPPRDAHFPQTN